MRRIALIPAMVLALCLAAAPRPAAAQISVLDMKNALVRFLLEQIGTPGAFEVTAGAVTEPEDGVTALNDVSVADGAGVWLTVRQVSFSWTPSALLEGRVEIDRLRIDGLRMTRLSGDPELEGGALAAQAPAEPFVWPRSPIPLRVNAFELRDVFVSERVLPQAIAFDGDGAVTDEGDAQTLRLTLSRRDAVEGSIDLAYERRFDTDVLALILEAAEAAGGLVGSAAGLPEDSASRVSLRAEGPPDDWRATLSASSDRVFEISGAARIAYAGPVSADVDLRLSAGESLDPAVRRALAPEARLVGRLAEGADGVVRIEQAFLQAADLDLKIDGHYGRADGAMDFALQAEARRGLSELAGGVAFERIGLDGRLQGVVDKFELTGEATLSDLAAGPVDVGGARLDLTVDRSGERMTVALGGQASPVRVDRLGPEALGEARLAFTGALENGRFEIGKARLETAALRASAVGEADLEQGVLALRHQIEALDLTPTLAAYDVDGAGALALEGRLDGPFEDLTAEGSLRGAALRVGATRLGAAEASYDFRLADIVSGAVTAGVRGGDLGRTRLSLAVRDDGRKLNISDFSAKTPGAALTGRADLNHETGLAEARFDLIAEDLRPLGRALDLPLSGALRGELTAAPERGAQALRIGLTADRLSVDDRRFASGPARMSLRDLNSGQGLDAMVDWRLARRDGAGIGALSVQARGALDALEFAAEATLRDGGDPAAALAEGTFRRRQDRQLVTLRRAEARFGAAPDHDVFALSEPLEIGLRGGVASFEGLSASTPRGGAVSARLEHASPAGLAFEATVEAFDLATLGERFGAPVAGGVVSADLSLDTRRAKAGGRLRAQASGLMVDKLSGAGAGLDAVVEADWDGRRLALSAEAAAGAQTRRLIAALQAPLRAGPGGSVVAPRTEPIEGAVRWSGEIADLWPLVPAPDHLLSGAADIDLRLGGTIAAPSLEGRVALTDGRYENIAFGTILEALTVTSRIEDGSRIRLDLEAMAGDGRAEAELALDLGAVDGATLRSTARFDEALVARRDDLSLTLSGDLSAEGPVAAPRISGALEINEAEYRLVGAPAAEIPDLGPVRPRGSTAPAPSPAETAAVEKGPTLDLAITAERRLFTRGRGLDAEWRADLAVSGYASAPRVSGVVEKLRGRLDLLGRRFELEQGEIVFAGATKIDPRLDLIFLRDANDLEGRVAVTGTASAPEIAFTSSPTLPEQEVLPRVLFGRSKQSLTAAEAAQLASGVATLMSGEAGLLDRARELTGLDVLDYGETSGGGEAVTAGRYVGDGVFVGARQPLDGKGGAAVVEVEVFDGVSVDAEVGQQGGSSVGATWRYDF